MKTFIIGYVLWRAGGTRNTPNFLRNEKWVRLIPFLLPAW